MQPIYRRQVHFSDTDAAGVVHFSRLLCYAEEAEHALLAELGIPLMGDGGWPRVHVRCDYQAPVRMGDTVDVSVAAKKVGATSVSWLFSMAIDDKTVASGEMKSVRVDAAGKAEELPDEWRDLLQPAS